MIRHREQNEEEDKEDEEDDVKGPSLSAIVEMI